MTHSHIEKSDRIILETQWQIFDRIVGEDHPFRRLNKIIHFEEIIHSFKSCYSSIGTEGLPIEAGFKALLVQFWEDYSDREMEKCLRENMAVRWFCGFGLTDETPDHSYFGKLRKRIGTKKLADAFNSVNAQLNTLGLFGNVFAFIDASSLITKTALWQERDTAIQNGCEKLNNTNVEQYAADPDARFGAKSKHKFWFGYKRHNAVDMRHGLILKVAVTPANVLDFEAVKNICPKQGMVFMDKGYDYKEVEMVLKTQACASGIIQKNNHKKKNFYLDSWRSKIRMPFESTFSKQRKRTRYRSLVKVTFQCFAEALIHNLKKAVRFLPEDISLLPVS